ncbi:MULTISPECIES: 50S ribosomal protein L19e [Archaeoglobus]|uniref:Large ribosomal subunit protein eL19 n=2 Tax=Archaeoglobus fulgidus TaxID=2234 RepID=A0A075WGH4_ARCFL|nr:MULTISPECIES: 50S ribosomal protein L19e [Archaeoglobus]AIG98902.1 Ribosomal protein L19E [Archaeoglobus fulgidus DSM 8774]KUJ93942.1 MAG: 50S ribosomal protein L19e [Archaeoglobus fulgidus]KUK07431.1 MAG: 50S ribosomal protein L19e [Archaeoglobus fulgidus]MDI3497681.1 large subunit ribosomal protein L19e [Archaeoglobus sp.]
MDLSLQRRLAASVLKCGENRVWFDPAALEDIATAATKQDIRELIEQGVIKRKPVNGVSRARINKRKLQKRKGRRRGHGSRKGAKGARMPRKRMWILRIRALRKALRQMKAEGVVDRRTYRILYRKAKGGEFRSVAHLKSYVEQMKR